MEMQSDGLFVRELRPDDLPPLIDYWVKSDSAFMKAMGVDMNKMPKREEWEKMLNEQMELPYEDKKSYCMVWELDGKAIGHSNVNKIQFGQEAYMHLHIWDNNIRKKGMGVNFVKQTLPFFFQNLQLKKVFCEPYALNPAPNKTLEKAGFKFLRSYTCVPGWLNFEQEVNLWEMNRESFSQ